MARGSARVLVCLAAMLTLSMIAGCAGSGPRKASPEEAADDGQHPAWPNAEKPRIVHRLNIRGSQQMAKPGFFDNLAQAIAGKQQQALVRPQSIAVHDDKLYIVDQEMQGIHVLQTTSSKSQFIGRADKNTYFVSPVGIAWCDNALAISDSALKEVFILSPAGKLIRKLQKPGGFGRPTGVAYDPQRKRLYVVDTTANRVFAFDEQGQFLLAIGGDPPAPSFHFPTYIAVDPQGRLLVADTLNFRVQIVSPEGEHIFEIGKIGNASGYLAVPKGVGVDSFGHIYIVDSYFSAIQIFSDKGDLLLSFGEVGRGSGQFMVPTGLLVTPDNHIYVCDSQNARVQMFDYVGEAP